MGLTIIPATVVMITLASQNRSPGGWKWIIILIVILILLGRRQFPDIARGMIESIYNFKAAMRLKPRQQDGDSRSFWFLVLALIAVAIVFSVLSLDAFSGEQKLALTAVLLGWIGVGYWAFGRNLRKRDGR
jgi:TatA/E family protein of Tat protein translocase